MFYRVVDSQTHNLDLSSLHLIVVKFVLDQAISHQPVIAILIKILNIRHIWSHFAFVSNNKLGPIYHHLAFDSLNLGNIEQNKLIKLSTALDMDAIFP